MPDVEEMVRRSLSSRPRTGPSSDVMWADVQRRIRRRKRRRTAVVGAVASVVVLAAGGLALAIAADGGDDAQTQVVDAGPGPSTTAAPPTTVEADEVITGWLRADPGPIEGREGYSATWTGSELVIFGGRASQEDLATFSDGAAYDPTTATWRAIAPAPLIPRSQHVAVWTGTELVVWGGRIASNAAVPDGAAYDPVSDAWRALADSPLPPDDYEAVWTGSEMVVIGGGEAAVTGAAYDPAKDTWREITPPPVAIIHPRLVWTGQEVLVVGGYRPTSGTIQQFNVWPWDPATDTWREQGGAPMVSQSVEAAWTGGTLVVWGHSPSQEGTWVLDGAHGNYRYADPFPAECEDRIESIAFDAYVIGSFCDTLAAFDPNLGTWTPVESPPGVANGRLVAADGQLLVYDGGDDPSLSVLTPYPDVFGGG